MLDQLIQNPALAADGEKARIDGTGCEGWTLTVTIGVSLSLPHARSIRWTWTLVLDMLALSWIQHHWIS